MMKLPRRNFLAVSLAALVTPLLAKTEPTLVEVWKDPSCGCCGGWIKYLQANGFAVRVFDTGNTAIRAGLRMPAKYGSCHTALVGGYAIEGHVPVREIRRLLKDKPVVLVTQEDIARI